MNPYKQIHPARAKTKNPDKLWDDSRWWCEEKLDGWRFLMHFGRNLPRVYLTGRRESKRTGGLSEKGLCAPQIWPNIEVIDKHKLDYTVIDGEVMAPTGFHDLAGIMNVAPEKAQKRIAEIGPPKFVAFDILFWNGEDIRHLSYIERRGVLCPFIDDMNHPLLTRIASHARPNNSTFYEEVVQRGGEGVVLKSVFGEYGEDWIKVKKYTTLDVVVTGFTEAKEGKTGKYLGLIGAALVSVYGTNGELIEVGRVSGMTDEIRNHMSVCPEYWIGSVIEIAATEFARERLRHPRFRRKREDANPRAATFTKMMCDLGTPGYGLKGQMSLF